MLEVNLATDELTLHFREARRATPAGPSADYTDCDASDVPAWLAQRSSISSLLAAVALQPRDARSYHALGEELRLAAAPPAVVAFHWGRGPSLVVFIMCHRAGG